MYENISIPKECPQPVVIAEEENNNTTDNSVDKTVETIFEGGRFFPPDVAEPSQSTGTFKSKEKFTNTVLKGTSPTLLCKGLDFVDVRNNPLPEIFPVQFSFGLGDVHDDRRNSVSVEAGLKHYLKSSLPKFHRPEFVLVITNMLNKIQSFRTGYIKCTVFNKGSSAGQKYASITEDEFTLAAKRRNEQSTLDYALRQTPSVRTDADRFLQNVSASCKAIGHSDAAAIDARKKFFALNDFAGMNSAMLTYTPDDETCFRVQLYATSEPQKLPKLDFTEEECLVNLQFRKKTRLQYPGACSLEFQSISQIIMKDFLG